MPQFGDPEFFRNVLESLQTAVYLVDREQKIIFWNDGAEQGAGRSKPCKEGHESAKPAKH